MEWGRRFSCSSWFLLRLFEEGLVFRDCCISAAYCEMRFPRSHVFFLYISACLRSPKPTGVPLWHNLLSPWYKEDFQLNWTLGFLCWCWMCSILCRSRRISGRIRVFCYMVYRQRTRLPGVVFEKHLSTGSGRAGRGRGGWGWGNRSVGERCGWARNRLPAGWRCRRKDGRLLAWRA